MRQWRDLNSTYATYEIRIDTCTVRTPVTDARCANATSSFARPPVAKVATKMKTAFALVAALAVSADAFAPASSSSFVGRSRSFAANDSALSMAMERTYIMVRLP